VEKSRSSLFIRIDVRQRSGIPALSLPGLEVHGFTGADAQQDSQTSRLVDVLCQRRIEASATLLDEGEVESRVKAIDLEVIGESGRVGSGLMTLPFRVGVLLGIAVCCRRSDWGPPGQMVTLGSNQGW